MEKKNLTINLPVSREELNIMRNAFILALCREGLSDSAIEKYEDVADKLDEFFSLNFD